MKRRIRESSTSNGVYDSYPNFSKNKRTCLSTYFRQENEPRTDIIENHQYTNIFRSSDISGNGKSDRDVSNDAMCLWEPTSDAWQDLRTAFSALKSSVDHQVTAQPTNEPLFEALLLPIDIPECESSTSCSGIDDENEDSDEKTSSSTIRNKDHDDECVSNSASYASLDVSSDPSPTRVPANENMSNTLKNIENLTEEELINSETAFNVPDICNLWPLQDENSHIDPSLDFSSIEEGLLNSDGVCLFFAMQQTNWSENNNKHYKDLGVSDEAEDFDPYLFIKTIPDLSEVVPSCRPMLLPCQTKWEQPITLVLDLDETLVHSTLEHCEDADFTFSVHVDFKEHTVYVRRRPHLQMFMEKVAQMFEIIVFTASQSIYAEQLLNRLDPMQKLISHRVYRDSCVLVDGNYMKDLTIFGRDLAKIAIIDNSPQAFRFQVENGIPIESWFDDRSDSALMSLLPFLESLVGVEDVRPIIAEKFNLRKKLLSFGLGSELSEAGGSLRSSE